MELALTATLVLSLFVGLAVGLLGGGGAILMVPILTYVTGWPALQAITVSLFVVGLTSLLSTLLHARKGHVRWKTGFIFGAIAMVGAFLGGIIGARLPETLLITLFAVIMLGSGFGMIRKRKGSVADKDATVPWARVTLTACAIGLISGLVGAGGGFLIVPALVLLFGFPMIWAVGTSVLVITLQSAAGFISHIFHTSIEWPIVAGISAIAMLGVVVGVRLGDRIPAVKLRKIFGYFVVAMAVFVLFQELVLA